MIKLFKKTLLLNAIFVFIVANIAHSAEPSLADIDGLASDNIPESAIIIESSESMVSELKPKQLHEKDKVITHEDAKKKDNEENKLELPEYDIAELLESRNSLIIENYKINKPRVKEIYNAYRNEVIWLKNGIEGKNFQKAMKFLQKAEENGFFKKNFNYEKISELLKSDDKYKYHKADILTTHLVSKLISDIANGRPVPKSLKAELYPKQRNLRVTDYVQAFLNFKAFEYIDEYILSISPKHEQYRKLRLELIKLNNEREEIKNSKKISIKGPNIIVGMRDYRVPLIRKKLGVKKPISPQKAKQDDIYDKQMQKAVIEYQNKFDLKEDGVIGRKTIAALNISLSEMESKIKANMERYRWLSDDLPETRIEINIPQFELVAYKEDEEVDRHAIIVGRKQKKTALMETQLYSVILNPYWHVPRNYALKQLLPILVNDENYLRDQEFDVFHVDPKNRWTKVNYTEIDWANLNENNFSYLLRQKPGKKNVLGPIKFKINNPFAIYLHSTTEPWLFSNKYKAYSSGCIRVERPDEFAKWLLENNTDFDMEKFDSIYSAFDNNDASAEKPKSVEIKLKKPMPTYIGYFTVIVEDSGKLKFINDLYNWDSGIIKEWTGIYK